ncbi:hypothetical protein FRB99_000982 [Tulasnella sp. 403]|nr:hypothetical protein FRB99_000982 [Tulasnella sp. 403]
MDANGEPIDVSGEFGDVYKGRENSIGSVALKRLRLFSTNGYKRWFEQEKRHWEGLNHDHILPLLGIAQDSNKIQYFVAPWMDRGSLWAHIKREPLCDRPRYLREIASALVYLHEKGIIHGDINAQNILVSKEDHAKLCDFGLSKSSTENTVGGLKLAGALRFLSPELWNNNVGKSKRSDVYAFGMTIYQVLSSQLPFAHYAAQETIRDAIQKKNEHPPCRPELGPTGGPYKQLWVVAEGCWQTDPVDRLTMNGVYRHLQAYGNPPPTNGSLPSDASDELDNLSSLGQQEPQQDIASLPPAAHAQYPPILPPPLHSQLISRLATISESVSGMTDARDLRGRIVFDTPSNISPYARSNNSSVYRAVLTPRATTVAIKVLHAHNIEEPKELDRLANKLVREIRVWKGLKHKRIIPLLGFAVLEMGACLISPWCINGNAQEYLPKHPEVNRRALVLQAAEGVVYLHTLVPPIIHGDLKASNILINDGGEAMLTDFGVSKLLGEVPSKFSTSSDQRGTPRWIAPELCMNAAFTTQSDVYEFGCLALAKWHRQLKSMIAEVMSGKPPFVRYTTETMIITAKISGEVMTPEDYPELPEDDPLWPLLRGCWAWKPENRPSMVEVLDKVTFGSTHTVAAC